VSSKKRRLREERAAAAAAAEAREVSVEAEAEAAAEAKAARKAARRKAKQEEAATAATADEPRAEEKAAGAAVGDEEAAAEPPRKKGKKSKAKATGEEGKPGKEAELEAALPAAAEPADAGKGEEMLSADAFRSKFHISSAREGQELPDPVQRFDDAPFSKKIRQGLAAAGFTAPSPIQAQGWPVAVEGRDLVAVAKTGSGKTLGFLLPAFRAISKGLAGTDEGKGAAASAPSVLVLAPTRELVSQIEAECAKFEHCSKVKSLAVFGGAPKGPQLKALKEFRPQVLVATPGRLQDLMEMKAVTLKQASFLVLDEADRMLDMGFEPEIAKIVAETRADRQTLLFTATWPKAVQRIARSYLREDHVHVNVGQTEDLAANRAVSQEFFEIGDDEKEMKLWRIIADLPESAKLIAFMNTKRRVDQYTKSFWEKGFEVAALHGDKAQWERERDLGKFARGECWLLFATDVCARGLDIRGVTHVVNFDMARDVEAYVHRIGRTGRAGANGASITFFNEAYDMECAPALAKIAREAEQPVPDFLQKAADKQKQAKNKLWRY